MFIRTQRLLLRPPWPEDLHAIAKGIGEFAVSRNLAGVPYPYDEAAGREWLMQPFNAHMPALLMTLPGKSGAPVIGGIGYGPRDEHDELELGYWIARPFWGRGYASEAANALVEHARMVGVKRLDAGHFADNPASGRVLQKAGFIPTGQTEQRFSLARGEQVPSVKYVLQLERSLPAAA
jgi:RimJ/RimL family protein N-acetyltransferase